MAVTGQMRLRASGVRPRALTQTSGFDALDLQLSAGEVAVLVGAPDLVKMHWLLTLAGFRRPDSGRLELPGGDGAVQDAPLASHRRGAYVSAAEPLLSTFTVRANVMLPRLYHFHDSPGEARRHADRLLDEMDYQGPRDALPAHLNRFERQQVLLARALVLDPPLLFLHEPFDLAAATHWHDIASHLRHLAREGRTLVIATQNLEFAAEHADHVVFLHDGHASVYARWTGFASAPEAKDFLDTMPIKPGPKAA